MQLEFSHRTLKKNLNTKFHETPSSVSRVIPCGQTEGRTDRRTDMTKPIVAFRNFANAPKNGYAENAKYARPDKYSLNKNSKHPTSNKRTFGTDSYKFSSHLTDNNCSLHYKTDLLMLHGEMIYLTATGLTPGGNSTVHIYTKQYIEQHNKT
jgi:hypothetical protein